MKPGATIGDLLPEYEDYLTHERHLAEQSIVAYLSDLRGLVDFLAGKPVADIQVNDLRAFMRDLSHQGYKTASIRRKFHGFGTFWRWLRMEGYTDEVLTDYVQLPKKPQRVVTWLNARDLHVFVETPPKRSNPIERERDRIAWLLLAWLGLRRSEVLNLEVEDVRLLDNVIIVRAAKGDKDRVLPLPPDLKDDLAGFIGERTSGYLLLGRDGTQWKVSAFNRAFRRHLRTCGMDGHGITPHTLRHTFATHLVAAGVPITIVGELLGHADIQSTMVYVHADMSSFRNAIAAHILAVKSTSL
jgi:site-specific recombinase XerD